jgi:hypothetical protein
MVEISAPTCPRSSSGATTREKFGNSVLSLLPLYQSIEEVGRDETIVFHHDDYRQQKSV